MVHSGLVEDKGISEASNGQSVPICKYSLVLGKVCHLLVLICSNLDDKTRMRDIIGIATGRGSRAKAGPGLGIGPSDSKRNE